MSYVDLAIGAGFFLIFLALVIGMSIQYFVEAPESGNIEEYRQSAVSLSEEFFTTSGYPDNWEDSVQVPSELGLSDTIYRMSVILEEPNVTSRMNETIVAEIIFDDECSGKVWDDTIRVYDYNFNELDYELVQPVYCSDQYINQSYIMFNVNISQANSGSLYIFYSEDTDIPASNSSIVYCTDSWIECNGDVWSESLTYWSRYGGDDGTPYLNSTKTMFGDYSLEIDDNFDSEKLGLFYQPSSQITGVSDGWYIDMWLYIEDISGLSSVRVSLGDGSDTITSDISINNIAGGEWYHLEKEIVSSGWDSWDSFNASNGIDIISVSMINSTYGITRNMKVDGVHFEIKPISVDVYPEDVETIISAKKISAMNNLTYEQLKDVTGEDYKFMIEIVES